jgi:hypothetical protein
MDAVPESQQWFPMEAWTRYEAGELMDLVVPMEAGRHDVACADQPRECGELAERMGGVLVRAAAPANQAAHERGGEDARGRDENCSAAQPVPVSRCTDVGGKHVDDNAEQPRHDLGFNRGYYSNGWSSTK